MSDVTFSQQLALHGIQAVGVAFGGGLSVLAAWGALRRQERIKRDEELAAATRKLQTDTLVRVLAALGRYHSLKTRRTMWEKHDSQDAPRVAASFKKQEGETFREIIDLIAGAYFLLGGRLGVVLRCSAMRMGEASTNEDADRAVAQLETELAPWIPPLKPHG